MARVLARVPGREHACAACEVLRRSISELCETDHRNDQKILDRWLANKTREIVASWIANPDTSVMVAVETANILAVGSVTNKGEITLSRVGGGALDCSRAGLRPPLKLGVQFSRTQLSRRRRSLSGDGRDHRNQVHKPVLAVELPAWQRLPTAAAPLVVPVRPDPPHQPSVEPVEELSDLGPACSGGPNHARRD